MSAHGGWRGADSHGCVPARRPGGASLIGWLLQTKAPIKVICANVLLGKPISSSATFTALPLTAVAIALLTSPVATPVLAKLEAVLALSS